MVTSKYCPSCRETKAAAEFGSNSTLGDGLSFYCLECNRAKSNAHYRRRRGALGREVRDLSWVPEGFRWCPDCKQAVAYEDYARNAATASGFGSRCKPCHNAHNKEAYWVRRYGLPRAGVDEIRLKQSNRCALCGEPDPEHLDHDHGHDFVRALLCQRCNFALGLLRDDPDLMRAAADYIEIHRARYEKASGHASAPTPGAVGRADVDSRPGEPPVGSQRRPGTRSTSSRSTGRASTARRQTQAGEADT
jgi:Recombination endonuclease VII